MPELYLDNFTNWSLSVVTYLWVIFGLVGSSTWMPQIQTMLYVHNLHWAYKSNKTTKVKFTVYWPVIKHVTVLFFQLTNMYKTIKALEGITRNNGNTLILPIIIVQGTVLVSLHWLACFLWLCSHYLITFSADTKVWTPIPYVTRHFRNQRGAASLRHRNRAEITVLMCEQKHYPVWFSCRRKSSPL